VLVCLLAAEGITIVHMRGLLSAHMFIGLVLIGPVLLKLGSTGYRMVRYYSGSRLYRVKGPPALPLRALAPVLIWRSVCQVSSIECPPRCCRLGVGETCCSGGEASGEVLDVGQSHMRGLATPGPWLRRWLTRV
jgi:hypothetical protein